MTKVVVTRNIAGDVDGGPFVAGTTRDLSEPLAAQLIASGYATAVAETDETPVEARVTGPAERATSKRGAKK